jgi:hypothetical protein
VLAAEATLPPFRSELLRWCLQVGQVERSALLGANTATLAQPLSADNRLASKRSESRRVGSPAIDHHSSTNAIPSSPTSSRVALDRPRGRPEGLPLTPCGNRRPTNLLKPRATTALARTVAFEDGSEVEVDAVIWATGFRPDYSWIDAPIVDAEGRLRHRRGVTDVSGLYFLGLTWQWTRGSALIGWVEDDARFIAEQIASLAHTQAKTRAAHTSAEEPAAAADTHEEG